MIWLTEMIEVLSQMIWVEWSDLLTRPGELSQMIRLTENNWEQSQMIWVECSDSLKSASDQSQKNLTQMAWLSEMIWNTYSNNMTHLQNLGSWVKLSVSTDLIPKKGPVSNDLSQMIWFTKISCSPESNQTHWKQLGAESNNLSQMIWFTKRCQIICHTETSWIGSCIGHQS